MCTAHKSESPVAARQVADQITDNSLIFAPSVIAAKDYATVEVKFALKGHTLQRPVYADDGFVTFAVVSRWGQSRGFAHWNDVLAFLAQIGGAT